MLVQPEHAGLCTQCLLLQATCKHGNQPRLATDVTVDVTLQLYLRGALATKAYSCLK